MNLSNRPLRRSCRAFALGATIVISCGANAAAPKAPTPIGNLAASITTSDYPATDLGLESGLVEFSIPVSEDGEPQGCQITSSSGFQDLDKRTCELALSRAKFNPAVNNKGMNVAGLYRNVIRWGGPPIVNYFKGDLVISVKELPPDIGAHRVTHVDLEVDKNGKTSDCAVQSTKASKGLETAACAQALEHFPSLPPIRMAGKNVESVQTIIVVFILRDTP